MATKYILVGGYPWKTVDRGKAFCEELAKGFEEPIKILDCLFARPEESWQEAFAKDQELFTDRLPRKKITLELAESKKFIEQVQWANAIYLRGGDTILLIEKLNEHPTWTTMLDGKTLVGTSAGADAISKYYYGLLDRKLYEGLGLLPLKTIVHYKSDYNAPNIDWDKAYAELKNYKEELPILALAEGQFEVRIL